MPRKKVIEDVVVDEECSLQEESVVVVEECPPLTIVDKQDRNKLGEGRSCQLGFAFLKKLAEREFETVHPISPCKDYLNDVVYSEQTGKQCTAYGLQYNKQDIFTEPMVYMAMKICPNLHGSNYTGQEKDEKNLNENYKKVEEFVNHFEELFKLDSKTTIEKVSDNLFHLTVPKFWSQYTYLISLYSLLVRCGQWYTEGDKIGYLSKFGKLGDAYNVKNTIPKIEKIAQGDIPDQQLSKQSGGTSIHNTGIVNFYF